MQHGASDESRPKGVSKPPKMARIVSGRRSVSLDLDAYDVLSTQLDNQVDLAAPVLLAEMVQSGALGGQLHLRSQLRQGKCVQDPS